MTSTGKRLTALGLRARGGADPIITDVTLDSRRVRPGALFAALPGSQVHGGRFIDMAANRGAAAVLTDVDGAAMATVEVPLIVVEDPRAALAGAAALWFGAQPAVTVAVTGTNGKTSVASFVRQLWQALGHPAVNLGTTGVEGDWSAPLQHTTPDAVTLHAALAGAADAGITHAAMEASSHGLDQRRLDAVALRAAGFTNFTQDHLDYHGTFEAYFDAKMGLFDRLLPGDGWAVVNLDDARGSDVAARAKARELKVLSVGRGADLSLLAQRFDATGQDLRFSFEGRSYQARLPLIGGFQAENALLAAGLVIAAGTPAADVFAVLGQLQGVRGRMQLAATRDNGAAAYVDYAHTPDAVATALAALRPHVMGQLVAVVGAGGDRDRGKRPLMGAAAAQAADLVIVTDDNPRSEDPASIRAEVLAGAPEATEIGDRSEAILHACAGLGPGDAALICGKGHETGQTVGDTVFPFDDVEQASIAMAALDGRTA